MSVYTAVIRQHGERWNGWVEEVPGVNSQGAIRDELLVNLSEALGKHWERIARTRVLRRH